MYVAATPPVAAMVEQDGSADMVVGQVAVLLDPLDELLDVLFVDARLENAGLENTGFEVGGLEVMGVEVVRFEVVGLEVVAVEIVGGLEVVELEVVRLEVVGLEIMGVKVVEIENTELEVEDTPLSVLPVLLEDSEILREILGKVLLSALKVLLVDLLENADVVGTAKVGLVTVFELMLDEVLEATNGVGLLDSVVVSVGVLAEIVIEA